MTKIQAWGGGGGELGLILTADNNNYCNNGVQAGEIMSRQVELGCESWTSFASGCSSTQCNGQYCAYSTAVKTAIGTPP